MKIFKCDRCGVIYEPKEKPPFHFDLLFTDSHEDEKKLDLCQGCHHQLEMFMTEVKESRI